MVVHFFHDLHSISRPITWTVSLNLGDPFIYNILLCAVYIIILLVCVCMCVCKKCKVHPCTGTEALYRPYGPGGSRGIALPFHDHGTRRG